ncbi:MAG: hypothetical protein FJZ04_03000 [Candidatus Moranbacteria bacterium]|nr:hypothetical protein [Candidatus Moranbacteria bacterium]
MNEQEKLFMVIGWSIRKAPLGVYFYGESPVLDVGLIKFRLSQSFYGSCTQQFHETVIAGGPKQAVQIVKDKMEQELLRFVEAGREAEKKAIADGKTAKDIIKGGYIDKEEWPFIPSLPIEVGVWYAVEVYLPGYRIKLEKTKD